MISGFFKRLLAGLSLVFSTRLTLGQKSRLGSYFFKTVFLKQNIIRSVEIIHTLKCNCHCSFCSVDKLSEKVQVMPKENVRRIIDQLQTAGIVAAIFLGGESLTDPNLIDYIAYARSRKMIPVLQTNGTLLTEEMIRRLHGAGLFTIAITLQDTIPEVHDRVVGKKDSLPIILKALPLLKKYKIKTTLKTLYSKETLASGAFERIRKFARRQGLPLNVNPFMPVGRGVGRENMLTGPDKKRYLLTTLADPGITTHTKTEYDSQCPAGNLYLGIFPNGEILPCYFLPISVGNIADTSIDEARRRAVRMGIFPKGTDSCIVALDTLFYDLVIRELYSGKFSLPVRYDDKRVAALLSKYLHRKSNQ